PPWPRSLARTPIRTWRPSRSCTASGWSWSIGWGGSAGTTTRTTATACCATRVPSPWEGAVDAGGVAAAPERDAERRQRRCAVPRVLGDPHQAVRPALEVHGGRVRRLLALPGGIPDPIRAHRRPPLPGAVPRLLPGAARHAHHPGRAGVAPDPADDLALRRAQELPAAQALGRLDVPRLGVRVGHRRGRVLDALPNACIEGDRWPSASSRP